MENSKEKDDRWRELAELLGLPPDKAGAKSAALPPPAPKPVPAPPAEEAPTTRHAAPVESEAPPRFVEETPRMEPIAEDAGSTWEAEFEGEDDATIIDEGTPLDEESLRGDDTPSDTEAVAAPGEEQPRRGRRRRRRGRRRGKDGAEGEQPRDRQAPQAPQTPEGTPRESSERTPRDRHAEPRDNRGRRDRGRERRDGDDRRGPPPRREFVETAEPEIHDEEPARQVGPLAVDDTDFSNWDVPSWQDLIASLYRPDR